LGDITDPSGSGLLADGIKEKAFNGVTYANVAFKAADITLRHSNKALVCFVDGHVTATDAPPSPKLPPTPLPVTAGNSLWLLGDGAGIVGSAVATWTDNSTKGANATLTGTGPKYAENANFGYINFTGGAGNSYTLSKATSVRTAFIVCKFAASPFTNNGSYIYLLDATAQGLRLLGGGTTTALTPMAVDQPATYGTTWIRQNGSAAIAQTSGNIQPGGGGWDVFIQPSGINNLFIAEVQWAATKNTTAMTIGNNWNGDIAEVVCYDSVLSTADRQKVEQFLGGKYGIAVGTNP
jgi:prepilin-type processing-associated H-X9-DG protein